MHSGDFVLLNFYVFQFSMLPLIYQIVVIAILTFVTIIEVIRLLAGYVGNLSEKVNFVISHDGQNLIVFQFQVQCKAFKANSDLILPK